MPPKCAIATCNNRYGTPGVAYHRFPKEEPLRTEWLTKCQVDICHVNTAIICSDHFADENYERDMRNELLGLPLRKKLLPDSVPSRNLPKEKPTLDDNKLEQQQSNNLVISDVCSLANEVGPAQDSNLIILSASSKLTRHSLNKTNGNLHEKDVENSTLQRKRRKNDPKQAVQCKSKLALQRKVLYKQCRVLHVSQIDQDIAQCKKLTKGIKVNKSHIASGGETHRNVEESSNSKNKLLSEKLPFEICETVLKVSRDNKESNGIEKHRRISSEDLEASTDSSAEESKLVKSLRDQVAQLQREKRLLEGKFRREQSAKNWLSATFERINGVLSGIFTRTQVDHLLYVRPLHWTTQDLAKAAALYSAVTENGYKYLDQNMNIPLPPLDLVKTLSH